MAAKSIHALQATLRLTQSVDLNENEALLSLIEFVIAPYRSTWQTVAFDEAIEYLEFATRGDGRQGRNCKKGYPCGISCISRTRKCRKKLEGQAATAQEWLKQNSPDRNNTQNIEEESATSKMLKRNIAVDHFSLMTVSNKNEFMEAAAKLPRETKASITPKTSVYQFNVGQNEVEFLSTKLPGLGEISRMLNINTSYEDVLFTQNISFTVDGEYSRQRFNPQEGTQTAIGVRRVMQAELAARPIGSIFSTSAFGGDGLKAQRQALYERVGFGKPTGNNFMYGRSVMRNGRIELEPINE